MLANPRDTPVHSPAPAAGTNTIMGTADNGSPVGAESAPAHASSASAPAYASSVTDRETRRERSRRKAHRSRLHGYAVLAVVLVAFVIALAASNTAHVKVNWLFGSSHVSLVWLVLIAALLGWLLGLVSTAAFHWRTRAPRRSGGI